MKHHEDCDRYQATLHSEGPWGDPDIIPESYPCYCPEPPKRVTITIVSPDTDGDYQVRVKTEGSHWKSEYNSELAEILPDSKEVMEWLA